MCIKKGNRESLHSVTMVKSWFKTAHFNEGFCFLKLFPRSSIGPRVTVSPCAISSPWDSHPLSPPAVVPSLSFCRPWSRIDPQWAWNNCEFLFPSLSLSLSRTLRSLKHKTRCVRVTGLGKPSWLRDPALPLASCATIISKSYYSPANLVCGSCDILRYYVFSLCFLLNTPTSTHSI